MTTFMVYANMPGYGTEDDDPYTTDSQTYARMELAYLIERDWDSEYEVAEDADERLAIDARYLDADTECNTIPIPGYVHVPGPTPTHLGRNYHIVIVEDEDDE